VDKTTEVNCYSAHFFIESKYKTKFVSFFKQIFVHSLMVFSNFWATHTHTRLTALFLWLPRWAGTSKVKTNLDFTEARDSEWQWHQLAHMQVCTLLHTDNHTSTPLVCFFSNFGTIPNYNNVHLPHRQQTVNRQNFIIGPELQSLYPLGIWENKRLLKAGGQWEKTLHCMLLTY